MCLYIRKSEKAFVHAISFKDHVPRHLYIAIAFGPVILYNDVPAMIAAIKEMKSGRGIRQEEDRIRGKKEERSAE